MFGMGQRQKQKHRMSSLAAGSEALFEPTGTDSCVHTPVKADKDAKRQKSLQDALSRWLDPDALRRRRCPRWECKGPHE